MGRRGREDNWFISAIPDDLKLFESTDIIKVFEYLEKEFHLNKNWHLTFKEELLKTERGISDQEHFFRFATSRLDPALQTILMRQDSVIFALARYIIRDRIKEKKREADYQRNFYRTDAWKNGGNVA